MGDINAHVMWSYVQIAERDGISKQAVAKKAAKLIEQHGIPVERDARGRVARISLAHYDHHLDLFGNSTKRAPQSEPEPSGNASYDEARRQQAWLDLDRKKLDHQRAAGELVRADREREALAVVGRAIQGEVNRLQNRADDLALAVSKEGTHGARVLLRKVAAELNAKIADALAEIAEHAPDADERIDEVELQ